MQENPYTAKYRAIKNEKGWWGVIKLCAVDIWKDFWKKPRIYAPIRILRFILGFTLFLAVILLWLVILGIFILGNWIFYTIADRWRPILATAILVVLILIALKIGAV